jgi:hypothetical protein
MKKYMNIIQDKTIGVLNTTTGSPIARRSQIATGSPIAK